MRTIIQYIRSLFCNHDWEHLGEINVIDHHGHTVHLIDRWRCKKCGYVQKSKT